MLKFWFFINDTCEFGQKNVSWWQNVAQIWWSSSSSNSDWGCRCICNVHQECQLCKKQLYMALLATMTCVNVDINRNVTKIVVNVINTSNEGPSNMFTCLAKNSIKMDFQLFLYMQWLHKYNCKALLSPQM